MASAVVVVDERGTIIDSADTPAGLRAQVCEFVSAVVCFCGCQKQIHWLRCTGLHRRPAALHGCLIVKDKTVWAGLVVFDWLGPLDSSDLRGFVAVRVW